MTNRLLCTVLVTLPLLLIAPRATRALQCATTLDYWNTVRPRSPCPRPFLPSHLKRALEAVSLPTATALEPLTPVSASLVETCTARGRGEWEEPPVVETCRLTSPEFGSLGHSPRLSHSPPPTSVKVALGSHLLPSPSHLMLTESDLASLT